MSTLRLAVANGDDSTRQRAVDALHDAGIEVARAWVDERPPVVGPVYSRDPVGITLGTGMAAVFGGLAGWALAAGGWWIAPGVVSAVVAVLWLAGLASAVQLKDRSRPRAGT